MADLMAGLLVYASTGRTLVFGTVHETFRVRYREINTILRNSTIRRPMPARK